MSANARFRRQESAPWVVGALKAKNEGSFSAATGFTCPPDPRYGTKPMEMAQAKATEVLRMLQSANAKKLQKAGEKSFKVQEKERIRMARMGIVRMLLSWQPRQRTDPAARLYLLLWHKSGRPGRVRCRSGDPDGAFQV